MIFFMIFALLLLGCADTSFNGKTEKSRSLDIEESQGIKEIEPERNNVEQAEKKIYAKEILNLNLGKSKSKFTSNDLPSGAEIKEGNLIWQSDLKDIGKIYEGVAKEDSNYVEFKVEVLPPAVKTQSCSFTPEPVIGDIEPELTWHWQGWTDPNGNIYKITYSSPVAGDLDGDSKIEVVTIPSTATYHSVNGPIVVLDALTGLPLWNSFEALGIGGKTSTTPAIIDLDGDGGSEIIVSAFHQDQNAINIFDYKAGTLKYQFTSPDFACSVYCIPAVADIDGDGKPEIAAGNVVLNADGTLKFWLEGKTADNARHNAITLANVDSNSPGLEIVGGESDVYSSTGKLLWKSDCIGFSAVGDLNRDKENEVICIGESQVLVMDKSGNEIWRKPIPGGGGGGAPNIGNFDDDPQWEVGTAGGDYYVVFNHDGSEAWRSKTQDLSSSSTGSTVFDFNGDGKVEVVYNDEVNLRIYDGATGTVLWETANPSGTLWEYPLVLNADDDVSVEIIVSAPSNGGIKLFNDPSNKWVGSKKLWNQYSYAPELISNDLKAVQNPLEFNDGFRVNSQGVLPVEGRILLPNLTAIMPLTYADDGKVFVYLVNTGEEKIHESVNLQLMQDDLSLVDEIIYEGGIIPGTGKLISFTTQDKSQTSFVLKINLNAQDQAITRECKIDDNILAFSISE